MPAPDPAAARAFREGAACVELPGRAVVEVAGRDRARFLHGMCTNEVKKLLPGQGVRAAAVTRQGRMTAVIHLLALDSTIRLFTDRDIVPALLGSWGRFLVADDVTFKVLDGDVFGVYGPQARETLDLPVLPDGHGLVREGRTIVRDARIAADGYEVLGSLTPTASASAWQSERIAAGVPLWGADMGPDLLPMEAGLEPVAISYSKGCYIGQEIIQRVKTYGEPPRMLVSLAFDAPVAAGTALEGDAGRVTSAAAHPVTGAPIGLALVRKEFKAPGTRVTATGGIGATTGPLAWQLRPAT